VDYRVLKGRAADRRNGWPDLHLTRRIAGHERGVLALLYVGFWLLALGYVCAIVR
jgi:hypothetical protein